MKNCLFSIFCITAICGLISCSKTSGNQAAYAGSWTFLGKKDTVVSTSVVAVSGSLNATTSSGTNPYEAMTFVFSSFPTVSGAYPVINYGGNAAGNYVAVELAYGSTNYISTGNDQAVASITVSPSGKVTISLPSVELRSIISATPDSAAATGIIVNQQ